jgi:DNA-binding response OmpR family regulator
MSRSNLDSFISLLRKKIDPPSEKRLVHTVKGVGYMVHVETDHLPTMHNEPVP